jgi:hypothetical protein
MLSAFLRLTQMGVWVVAPLAMAESVAAGRRAFKTPQQREPPRPGSALEGSALMTYSPRPNKKKRGCCAQLLLARPESEEQQRPLV